MTEIEQRLRAVEAALDECEQKRRHLLEDRMRSPSRHQLEKNLLLSVSQAASRALNLEEVLQAIVDGTAELMNVETAAIYILEEGELYLGAAKPPLDPNMPVSFRWTKLEEHLRIERAVVEKRPVVMPDAWTADLTPQEKAIVESRKLRSGLYLPLLHEDEAVGVLILSTISAPREYSQEELELCQTVANQLSLALQTVRLHQRLKRHAADLERQVEERLKAERKLTRSEEKFRALFEQAGDYILLLEVLDKKDIVIVDANEAALHHHGYRREELLGRSISTLDHTLDFEQFGELVQRVMDGEALRFESVHTRRDGSTFPVEVSSKLVNFGDDSRFVISIERDISERVRAKKLEEQLLQAQKMEALGQLAGGVAHDFNNLLQIIIGYTEELKLEDGLTEEAAQFLDYVSQASDRAAVLVRQLLAFSRRQVLEVKVVDLNDLVGNLMQMMRRVLGEHIELGVTLGPKLEKVLADPGQIEQILVNLLVNARDAMPDGGAITLETGNVTFDEVSRREHGLELPGRYVHLSLTDSGCGMDEQTRDKAFEPFFTTKGPGDGTGLGLATVYGLVEQHHGLIELHSELGVGTTFDIYLPVVDEAGAAEEVEASGEVVGGSETILLAEDSEMVRTLARSNLERVGYTVIVASDGDEALRVLESRVGEIDLALLDVVMPKRSGRDVARRLRELRPEVSVLFSSGYAVDVESPVPSAGAEEAVEILRKPYGREELLRRVRSLLDQTK